MGCNAMYPMESQSEMLVGFLLCLFFDPANGNDMFLQNVGCFSTDCITFVQEE
jgi:hypothetical protein